MACPDCWCLNCLQEMEPHLKHWSTMVPWTKTREKDENSTSLNAGQWTHQKNDGELSSFHSFVLVGRLNYKNRSGAPSIAANSNKQECWLFLTVKKYRRWKTPQWVREHRGSFWKLECLRHQSVCWSITRALVLVGSVSTVLLCAITPQSH